MNLIMPSLFGNSLFDEWIYFPFDNGFDKEIKQASRLLKMDVKEHKCSYELEMGLPGYKKKDIVGQLNGYLTIQGSRNASSEEEGCTKKLYS